jgi:hypothetical protein
MLAHANMLLDASGSKHVYCPTSAAAAALQLLAHANMLLDAAAAEPQWLRGRERRFESKKWAAVIAQAQLLATRCVCSKCVGQQVRFAAHITADM